MSEDSLPLDRTVVSITACVCALLTLSMYFMAGCETKRVLAVEQTRQEAIKAGLVEGEQGRWKKPDK